MPATPLGSVLDTAAATPTLSGIPGAWQRGNPPYDGNAAYPWGNQPLSALKNYMAGYLFAEPSFDPTATQADYPAFCIEPNEVAVYENGDAIALLGKSVMTVVEGQLVITPRLANAAELAAIAATPAAVGRTFLSGAYCTAPYVQGYGYTGVVMKLPKIIAGVWPAAWKLPGTGAQGVEIDVLEALLIDGKLAMTCTVHTNDPAWNAANPDATAIISVPFDPTAEFIEYGLDFQADSLTFFWGTPGAPVAVRSVPTPSDFIGVEFYDIINLALGGVGSWAGPLPAGTTAVGDLTVSTFKAFTGTITAGAAAPPVPAITVASVQAQLAQAVAILEAASANLAKL